MLRAGLTWDLRRPLRRRHPARRRPPPGPRRVGAGIEAEGPGGGRPGLHRRQPDALAAAAARRRRLVALRSRRSASSPPTCCRTPSASPSATPPSAAASRRATPRATAAGAAGSSCAASSAAGRSAASRRSRSTASATTAAPTTARPQRDGEQWEDLGSVGIGARIDVRPWLTLTPEIARQTDGIATDTTDPTTRPASSSAPSPASDAVGWTAPRLVPRRAARHEGRAHAHSGHQRRRHQRARPRGRRGDRRASSPAPAARSGSSPPPSSSPASPTASPTSARCASSASSPRRFAVEGSPADCVLAGLHEILKDGPPDLVISGVNRGHNVAEDTLYSGTVGGAMEGALHGVRAVALSQYHGPATADGRPLRRRPRPRRGAPAPAPRRRRPGRRRPTPSSTTSTSPPVPAAEVRGTRATFQGHRAPPTFGVLPHVAPNGRTFLWLTHGHGNADSAARLGLARVPRRLHHRDAAGRRPHRARPHRAACAGARLARGSRHAPRRTADAVRLHPPLARGDQRRGAEGDGADAARRLPRRHLPRALLRGHAAADRLRPDHQPADRRRPDDPGARGRPAAARCSRSAPAPATRRRSSSRLARRVYTVERHRRLARRTRELFQRLGLHNITVVHGDGSLGLPEQAPFDRIIVTAAAEDPPQVLIDQLRAGGIMVLPVGQ